MLFNTLLVVGSAALAFASPLRSRSGPGDGPSCTPRPRPVLPVNGGGKELAAPSTELKAIILGFGIQNYTCSGAGEAPRAIGALAMLYDITKLYPNQGPDSLSMEDFTALTTTALWNLDVPLNLEPTSDNRIAASRGASLTDPFPAAAPLELEGMKPIPFAGHHIFNSLGQPQFMLPDHDINFVATKLDDAPAPATADRGPEDTGAVAWLHLGALPGSTGAQYVYRVLTAGGVSHGCAAGPGADSTTYATTYWFYG
ncbi:hypothetical protein B0I35DRAFT_474570 [Stachybotrys elegans]|uniref:Malate dehydrogenase n=1 Tax=Stachybotrys elegans TaxID=80388 RepID=A0A8K0SXH6_9HYPO|nr:hypothetical protein B0I35DRAFT_474570 [Stachybotrys elegans]